MKNDGIENINFLTDVLETFKDLASIKLNTYIWVPKYYKKSNLIKSEKNFLLNLSRLTILG
jgi:hypothetical protein